MANPTEQAVINDFTPGIFSDYHGGEVGFIHGKNGAAVVEDTFRCCADPSGALGPLPKAVAGNSVAISANQSSAYYPTNQNCWYILDANIMGPTPMHVISPSWNKEASRRYLSGEDNYQTTVSFGFFNAPFGDGATGYYWHNIARQYYMDASGAGITIDIFYDNNADGTVGSQIPPANFPRDIQAGGLAAVRATNNAVISFNTLYGSIAGIFSNNFIHAAVAAIIAPDAALTTFDTDMTTSTGNYGTSSFDTAFKLFAGGCSWYYPDPASPTGSTYWVNAGVYRPLKPNMIITHQDRAIIVDRDSMNMGNNQMVRDAIAYTAIDDPKALAALSRPFKTEYGSDNVSGIGVIASISTDRLLLVKSVGGGYIVQGDLNNPTVTKLPFVESTYNIVSYPAVTPFGVVYGTRNGVFLWNGGETSEKLSNQVEGMFWDVRRPAHAKYEGPQGRFAWWHPWVMVPNNYIMDSRTKAWWRLETPIVNPPTGNADANQLHRMVYQTYVVNPANGKLHAFLNLVTRPQATFEYIYDPKVLNSTYSWKSHPLAESREDVQSYQQIVLMASGVGTQTVAITLTGINNLGIELTPVTETFNFTGNSSGRPAIMRHNLKTNFVAMDVQVKIVVTSNGTNPAAKIHSFTLNMRTANKTRIDQ